MTDNEKELMPIKQWLTSTNAPKELHDLLCPQPSADVDYNDYIKRTPIHITMAEMIIDELKGGLGNQVYIDALEDHVKALQRTKTPENVRCEDLTNTDVRNAYEGLIIYNLWRRGSDLVEDQPDPKTLGIWIETGATNKKDRGSND